MTEEKTTEMIEAERYLRQKMLWGDEGQNKLANARVAIVGLDWQGKYTALCLAALGVGNVVLIDGSDADGSNVRKGTTAKSELFLDMVVKSGSRAKSYPELLKVINQQVNFEGYTTNLESRMDLMALEGATVIVDATNSIKSKSLAIAYGREKGIPVISTSSKWGYTKLMATDHNRDLGAQNTEMLMPMFEGYKQDSLMALMMCGVIAEEVKKVAMGNFDKFLEKPVRYKLGPGYRYGFLEKGEDVPLPDKALLARLKLGFLGVGALGNWGAIAASHMGFGRVDTFDYDKFESHNVNRQLLAYDGIDKLKSEHIAAKIVAMTLGRTRSTGYNELILPGFETKEKYDLVFDFVDNRYTRALNCAYAISTGTPLISSGALPDSARWDTHQEGKTQCMNHLMDIYKEGMKEEMIRRASCAANPNPSVVMSNAVGGVGAVIAALSVFEPEKFGEPFNGQLMYRADLSTRFGTSELVGACDCYSKPVPDLRISQKDIDKFVAKNPQLLQQTGTE